MRKPWIEKTKGNWYLKREVKKIVDGNEAVVRESTPLGPDPKLAKKIRDKYRSREVMEGHGLLDRSRTVQAAFNDYLAHCRTIKKPRTCKLIESACRPFLNLLGGKFLVDLSSFDLETLKEATLQKSKNTNGLNIRLVAIKAFLSYCVRRGYILENPGKLVKKEKRASVARFLTNDEIGQLLRVAARPRNHKCEAHLAVELPQIIKVALYTGMRFGEVLELSAAQIRSGYILAESKTDVERRIPIHREILPILTNRAGRGGRLFPVWSRDKLNWAFHYTVTLAEIGRVRFHDLRHTFCSRYLESGGTLADLALITGHQSLETLKIYAHFQDSYLKERVQQLNFGEQNDKLKIV